MKHKLDFEQRQAANGLVQWVLRALTSPHPSGAAPQPPAVMQPIGELAHEICLDAFAPGCDEAFKKWWATDAWDGAKEHTIARDGFEAGWVAALAAPATKLRESIQL